jgi:hypothetical protein
MPNFEGVTSLGGHPTLDARSPVVTTNFSALPKFSPSLLTPLRIESFSRAENNYSSVIVEAS